MHIACVQCNMRVPVVFQLVQMKQLTLILYLTQPPCKCALTGLDSGCTLTTGAAGCILTIGAAQCTPMVGAAGCTLTVGAAGSQAYRLIRAGDVLRLWPRGLHYALVAQASQDLKLVGKSKCNMYSILRCNMHISRAIGILHKYPY